MSETCIFPLCSRKVERNEFCFLHAKHFAGAKEVKEKVPIAKSSDKRKVEQKKYVAIVKEMLKKNPLCEIKSVVCTGRADGLHHLVKRSPKNFTQRSNLLRACNMCNSFIENNPLLAIEKGWSVSKHIPCK